MKDSFLLSADMRRFDPGEDHTPEAAIMHGAPPYLDCGKGVDRVVFMTRVMSVATEYLKDYDLVAAAARAGEHWEHCRYLKRDPVFIRAVRHLQEKLTPEEIITRAELLNMLKHEASSAGKASDRIAAAKTLASIAGFVDEERGKAANNAPTINITLSGPAGTKAEVNVTPAAPLRVLEPGEELL